MIVAFHLIFGMYGFWLPNDPRGSWSTFVGSWNLFRYGPATKTTETSTLAHRPHNRAARLATKEALKYPAVELTGIQARAVGRGFANYIKKSGVQVWACAILPDHVHLVTAPAHIDIEQVAIQLKGAATRQLLDENLHPFGHIKTKSGRPPKCFARGEWKVFLDPADVPYAIDYVERNPEKEGKPRQNWPFVTKYIG